MNQDVDPKSKGGQTSSMKESPLLERKAPVSPSHRHQHNLPPTTSSPRTNTVRQEVSRAPSPSATNISISGAAASAIGSPQSEGKKFGGWGGLSIEIEKPYSSKEPEWHPRDSESTITDINDESMSSRPTEPIIAELEPKAVVIVTRCAACILVAMGLAQVIIQITAFAHLAYNGTWWSGLFAILVGCIGLVKNDCLGIYHRAFCVVGILICAIGAVLDSRVANILHNTSYCGSISDPSGDISKSLGDWCDISNGCGCVIPGSDYGARESCILYKTEDHLCQSSANTLRTYVDVSMALCWTLACVCLSAFLARAFITCLLKIISPGDSQQRKRGKSHGQHEEGGVERRKVAAAAGTQGGVSLDTLLIARREGVLTPIFR